MSGRLMLYLARVAARDEIIAWCDELLDAASFDDYGPNGLQVAGAREALAFADGPGEVRSVGIVSGGGADMLEEAVSRGLDALISGEPSEPAMADAREAGMTFIAGGHYATETFGIRALGERIAEE